MESAVGSLSDQASADTVVADTEVEETSAGPFAEAPVVAFAVVETWPVTAPTAEPALMPAQIEFAAAAVHRAFGWYIVPAG